MGALVIYLVLLVVIVSIFCIVANCLENSQYEDYGNLPKRLRRIGISSTLGLFILVAAFGCFYYVEEQENAVVETFGVPTLVQEAGPHFKIPFIQKVEKVDTIIQGMTIGYTEGDNESLENESLMITNDYNFVNVDFYIEYQVSSPIDYHYSVKEPEVVLKNILLASIRSIVSNYSVDAVLTTEKGKIQSDIKERVLKSLDEENIGLTVTNVVIQDAEPPTEEVIAAFKDVETAKQQMETKINEANKYTAEKIPASDAEVDKILQDAETQKETRINEAEQQVAMFNAMYEEYVKDKETTKKRMFFEAMEELLPDLKVIVNGSEMELNGLYPIENFVTNNITNGGK